MTDKVSFYLDDKLVEANQSETIWNIAKREGIIKGEKIKEIQVEAKLETMFKKIFVDNIDYDNDDIKEDMFKTKLMAFELPHVKSSTNRELKTKLRKVETFKDLIDIVLKF